MARTAPREYPHHRTLYHVGYEQTANFRVLMVARALLGIVIGEVLVAGDSDGHAWFAGFCSEGSGGHLHGDLRSPLRLLRPSELSLGLNHGLARYPLSACAHRRGKPDLAMDESARHAAKGQFLRQAPRIAKAAQRCLCDAWNDVLLLARYLREGTEMTLWNARQPLGRQADE